MFLGNATQVVLTTPIQLNNNDECKNKIFFLHRTNVFLCKKKMLFLCKKNIFVCEDEIFFLQHSNGTKRGLGRYGLRKY